MMKRGRSMTRTSRSPMATAGVSPFSSRSRSSSGFRSGWRTYNRIPSQNRKTLFQSASSPEQKNLAAAVTFTAAANTGVITFLNGCAQGVNTNQHVGRKIRITQIHLRSAVSCTPNTTNGVFGRVIIVYDKETNGAAPIATDILETDTIESFNSLVNSDRFTTVYDSGIVQAFAAGNQGGATPVQNPSQMVFQSYRKCGLEVVFSGTGATVASIETGGLFALTYLVGLGAAPGGVAQQSTCRVRYTDL